MRCDECGAYVSRCEPGCLGPRSARESVARSIAEVEAHRRRADLAEQHLTQARQTIAALRAQLAQITNRRVDE